MAQISDLHSDLLNIILLILATSSDGARDIVMVSSTSKELRELTGNFHILRVVNIQRLTLTNDYTMHHHINSQLCVCARAGNHAALSILGKALLNYDTWFWNMIWMVNQEAINVNLSAPGLLHHHRLVRSFIRHGSSVDIGSMRHHLLRYVVSFAGYDVARENGILYAITYMCFHEMNENDPARNLIRKLACYCAHLMPRHLGSQRECVIDLFDKLFPFVLV